VLSQDLTKATPKEILDTQVLQTVVGGRIVYQKK
jgi:predicted amidohydrolase YtcJ